MAWYAIISGFWTTGPAIVYTDFLDMQTRALTTLPGQLDHVWKGQLGPDWAISEST